MDEAEALADRIAIIAAGRIVASGTPVTIGGRATGAGTITFRIPDAVSAADLPGLPAPVTVGQTGVAGLLIAVRRFSWSPRRS
jgi:ABC-2 type transport system ATP-binding protein